MRQKYINCEGWGRGGGEEWSLNLKQLFRSCHCHCHCHYPPPPLRQNKNCYAQLVVAQLVAFALRPGCATLHAHQQEWR